MKRDEAVLLAFFSFLTGVLLAGVVLVKPLNHQTYRVLDLQGQLAACDSGRDGLHEALHVRSDSVLLLEHRTK